MEVGSPLLYVEVVVVAVGVSWVLEVIVPEPEPEREPRAVSSVNNPVVVLVPVIVVSVVSVYSGVLPLFDDDPAEKKFSSDSDPPLPRELPNARRTLPLPPPPIEVNSSPKSVNELVLLNELLRLGAITLGSPGYKYPSLETFASSDARPEVSSDGRAVLVPERV